MLGLGPATRLLGTGALGSPCPRPYAIVTSSAETGSEELSWLHFGRAATAPSDSELCVSGNTDSCPKSFFYFN